MDTRTREIIGAITGEQDGCIRMTYHITYLPGTRGLYYTINYCTGTIYTVNLDSGEVIDSIETGRRRCGLPAVDPQGRELTIANRHLLLAINLYRWPGPAQ